MPENQADSTVEALQQLIEEQTDDDHFVMIRWPGQAVPYEITPDDLEARGPLVCWRDQNISVTYTCHYLSLHVELHQRQRAAATG